MRKELLLVSGLLIGSMAFAIDPAEIDSLINLKGVVVSANKIHVNRNSVPLTTMLLKFHGVASLIFLGDAMLQAHIMFFWAL